MKVIRVNKESIWALAGVYYVRTEAMVLGFGCSLEGEFGGDSMDSEYILVTDDDGIPLSTCRIHISDDNRYAKIERVATVSSARGTGAGRAGILEAEKVITERGIHKIIITSRDEAAGFYEKLGYTLDETMDPDTLKPYHSTAEREEKIKDAREKHPLFVTVYMSKDL